MLERMIGLLGKAVGISAGMSILLSVAGFLVLRAHANLLGIAAVHHHSIDDFPYEGGYFLITTIVSLTEAVITTSYGWMTLTMLGLMTSAHYVETMSHWCKKQGEKTWVSLAAIITGVALIYFCFLILLPPESARDLLFSTGNELEIQRRANPEGLNMLIAEYKNASGFFLFAVVALALGRMMISPVSFSGRTLRFISYGILFVTAVLLPINYGLKVYPSNYYKVTDIETSGRVKIPGSKRLWLLGQNDHEFLLYQGDDRRIILVERAQVLEITLIARANVFKNP